MLNNTNVAVFIDAENVGAGNAKRIFDEASNYGDIVVKRIFADWSKPELKNWREEINRYSITPEQQFGIVSKKNCSDIALIIQTMVVLFEKNIDVFCLVSGDSDFTRLVQELRERNKTVIGMGGRNVNAAFVNAFSEYVYLEGAEAPAAKPKGKGAQKKAPLPAPEKAADPAERKKRDDLIRIVERLIDDNDGKAFYARINSEMKQKHADFVPGNYGCNSFKKLMEQVLPDLKKFESFTEEDGTTMYLRRKNKR